MDKPTSKRTRRVRRALVGLGIAGAAVIGITVPSQAQTTDPTPSGNNFVLAGVKDAQAGTMLSIDTNVTGAFSYCNNPNGLGAELYLDANNGAGMSVRHATVTPFVVPIHIGLLRVTNPDPANTIDEEMITLGVVKGTSVQFGQTGVAQAEYGGLFFGRSGAGLVNWRQAATVTCTDSLVMPILQPLIDQAGGNGNSVAPIDTTTTTTVAPVDTTTTLAPTTTVAP